MTGEKAAVAVRGLRKSYGERRAVDDVELTVVTGEVFALLGPNGAGKTTTVEILEGYRSRDAGEVMVLGQDPPYRHSQGVSVVYPSEGAPPVKAPRKRRWEGPDGPAEPGYPASWRRSPHRRTERKGPHHTTGAWGGS